MLVRIRFTNFVYVLTLSLGCWLVSKCDADDAVLTLPNQNPAQSTRLALPPQLFAVVGIETNVYFDNVFLTLNTANVAFDVTCERGRQQAERWTWTPTNADVGEVPFRLKVLDGQNQIITEIASTIHVFRPDQATEKATSLLIIGDSLTHTSVYSQHLLDLVTKWGSGRLTLVGSHGVDPELGANRHEGYGGWTAERFATFYSNTARQGDYSKRGSPFLYKQTDGTTKLDFEQYCKDVNEGRFPESVAIFLGPNDIFSFNDESIAAGIAKMLKHFDQLIEMLRSSSPTTRVGVMLPVPPASSQDAFGSNYGSGQTRWQYKRNQHALVQAMIERYHGRQAEMIHVIATHANLDCVHNYPTESMAPNARSDLKIIRQNNGVHPSVAGYHQIGDTVFAWLMSR